MQYKYITNTYTYPTPSTGRHSTIWIANRPRSKNRLSSGKPYLKGTRPLSDASLNLLEGCVSSMLRTEVQVARFFFFTLPRPEVCVRKCSNRTEVYIYMYMYVWLDFQFYISVYTHENIRDHNSLGCEQPSGLDVNQSLNVQDTFWPIPVLISCIGVYNN